MCDGNEFHSDNAVKQAMWRQKLVRIAGSKKFPFEANLVRLKLHRASRQNTLD